MNDRSALSSGGTGQAELSLRSVGRAFENRTVALRAFDLAVPAGQFLAVLGPSGSGKSTLLRIIGGLDEPTSGEVRVDRSGGVGYVFQDAHLLPWRNVVANVALPLELAGAARAARLATAAEALARVGLAESASLYPSQLSGGMRMRVSLARALVTRPKLLLLDEPFAALDEITRQQLDDQLRTLWQASGITVIFVTHSMMEAAHLAERAIVVSRRPARVVLDHAIDLPAERAAGIRASAEFARELGILQAALQRGFDLPDGEVPR